MRLYPDVPARRLATLAGDALVFALLLLFAWLGLVVHDAVDRLAVLGEGVQATGGRQLRLRAGGRSRGRGARRGRRARRRTARGRRGLGRRGGGPGRARRERSPSA